MAHAFAFTKPVSRDYQAKLSKLLDFYEWLKGAYGTILKDCLMTQTIQAFRTKFPEQAPYLNDVKILDFIFWSVGKLIRTKKLTAVPNRVFDPARREPTSLFVR